MKADRFKLCTVAPSVRIDGICSAFAAVQEVGYFYVGESHDFWESVFVFKGCAGVTAGETVYTLREGQMIFHPPGEFHRLWNGGDDSLRIAIVTFSAESFPIDSHRICEFSQNDTVLSRVRDIRRLFVTDGIFVERLRAESSAADVQRAVGALENLFAELLGHEDGGEGINVQKDKFSTLYSAAVKVMKSDIGRRLSAAEIASACGMSVSTMQKLFYRYTGMGMMKYYESIRMKRAQALLADGYTVKETAMELGYCDQNYFSTAYKRFFGTPPSAYFSFEKEK